MGAAELFSSEPLKGVGEEVWRLLWAAAQEYSTAIAYPSATFPVVESDGKAASCVLCQQSLDAGAADRLLRFQDFVAGALNKKADEAATAVDNAGAALPNLDALGSDDWISRMDQVRSRNPALAERLEQFRDWATQRLADATQILAGGLESPTAGEVTCPSNDLTSAAGVLSKQAKALAESENPEARKVLLDEQQELADRKQLSASVDQLKARRDLLRTLSNYDKALAEVQTTPVTSKANKLVESHLTAKVIAQFDAERSMLEIAHLQIGLERESGKTGAKFGTRSGTDVTKSSSDFLSEGEQRALALSAFLTEVVMTEGAGPIVVDDPVCSLDRERCRKVADRLVEEAKSRQVVVFTHDLIFFNDLAVASHEAGSEPASVALYANSAAAGHVDPSGVNWHGKPLSQRVPVLKAAAKSIEGLHDTSPSDYEYEAKNLYGRLRDTYERVVEECLFAGVISRGADRIETLKLRYVHVTDDLANKFYEGMTTANTYSHDNPAAATVEPPTPEKILEHISELEAVIALAKTERAAAEARRPLMKGFKTAP